MSNWVSEGGCWEEAGKSTRESLSCSLSSSVSITMFGTASCPPTRVTVKLRRLRMRGSQELAGGRMPRPRQSSLSWPAAPHMARELISMPASSVIAAKSPIAATAQLRLRMCCACRANHASSERARTTTFGPRKLTSSRRSRCGAWHNV